MEELKEMKRLTILTTSSYCIASTDEKEKIENIVELIKNTLTNYPKDKRFCSFVLDGDTFEVFDCSKIVAVVVKDAPAKTEP